MSIFLLIIVAIALLSCTVSSVYWSDVKCYVEAELYGQANGVYDLVDIVVLLFAVLDE